MKIDFEEQNDKMIFRVSDFDRKYEEILKMCFYVQNDGSYIKKFPLNATYLEKIMNYYSDHAQEMFDQLGYFRPVPWEKALSEFADVLKNENINWWLTGSCAVCLRGIPFQPHDIDIMIDSCDADRVSDIFSDFLIEPIVETNGWLTKDFGVIFKHARIDIASDPQAILDSPTPIDCGPFAKTVLEEVIWEGFKIKVPPLELSLNANKRRERFNRVKMIEEFLNKTT